MAAGSSPAARKKETNVEYEIRPLTDEEADYIGGKLSGYVRSVAPPRPGAEEEKAVLKIEDNGTVVAGCILKFFQWGWERMLLAALWVDERYRGQGLASMLICEAERLGREKGCYISCLGTLVFQARPLYEKHGYTVFTVNKDFPRGHEGYSLSKRLDRDIPDYIPKNNSAASRFTIRPGTEEDAKVIAAGLDSYTDSFAPDLHEEIPICRKLVDRDGKLVAGIIGGIGCWDELDVDVLWVEEPYRGRGIGSWLLGEFEREAREKGAYAAVIGTFDWQVEFFRKRGYAVVRVQESPAGGYSDYLMIKEF